MRLAALLLLGLLSVAARAERASTAVIFALYFAEEPRTDALKLSEALLAGEFRELADLAPLKAKWEKSADFPPPAPASLRYAAKGVSSEAGELIAIYPRVLGLVFQADNAKLPRAIRLADEFVARLADATGGFPWDDECRLLYSAAEWRRTCVDTWKGDIPDVRGQVNMHAYRNPELVRVITLGMRKFNLPDLVMADVVPGWSTPAGRVVNACAQLLLEGAKTEGGRLKVDFAKVRHPAVRDDLTAKPEKGATASGVVAFRNSPREEGDPNNRLWAIDFPEMKAPTLTERESLAFAKFFGAKETIEYTKHGDPEMAEASAKARRDFFALADAFRRGLAPNERLLVKKGFVIGDQTEFMWVEVLRWNEDSLEGILANDSDLDPNIRHGQRVTVDFKEVYDYIHYRPDGTEAGNETGKVFERRHAH